ncbi:radical SAM protein [candidate division WOR-3 bacterium]|uniref:Radical SAM protein n=1 Tax=candidate division WOR-3 bacterium TaxID=2052148 RepID=A0A937XEM0_UNCW3|nr:radical SAM protein [candidate division WOR-3 bacterium]
MSSASRRGHQPESGPLPRTQPSPYIDKVRADRGGPWRKRGPLLGHLDIELTERCNNDCIHCCINLPANDRLAREREMTTDEVKSVLTEAADLGCLSVRFTGGEPLLRDDFEDLYLFARRQGMKVLLFTNARLVTPQLADLFARVPPGELAEVTVYGMKPESYEAVSRSSGSYTEFRRGIDLLLECRVPFVVKGVLLPPNRREMDEFETWAATITAMDKPPGYSMFFDLRGRRDSEVKNRQIAGLRLSPEEGVDILSRNRAARHEEMRQFCSKFMGPAGERLFACGAGRGACIDAYGRAQMCLMLRHPDTTYDLKAGSLRDALTNFFPRLRERRATNPDYLARCARCFLKGLCEQCPAKSWAEQGTLDTPVEYLCDVAHAQARDLGLLFVGERAWEVRDGRSRSRKLK